jgi:hypothetical protein
MTDVGDPTAAIRSFDRPRDWEIAALACRQHGVIAYHQLVALGLKPGAFWPGTRLVVELDSYKHHHLPGDIEDDHERLLKLQLAGYRVLPFTYRQVTERPAEVAAAVKTFLSAAA